MAIIKQALLQVPYPLLENTAHFSCNLIMLNRYPLLFMWQNYVTSPFLLEIKGDNSESGKMVSLVPVLLTRLFIHV